MPDGRSRPAKVGDLLFVDVEATTLGADSHAIEIGWIGPTRTGTSMLVRHEPHLVGWIDRAHPGGLTLELVRARGTEPDHVLHEFLNAANGMILVSDAPVVDAYWLNDLANVCGLELPELRWLEPAAAVHAIAISMGLPEDVAAELREAIGAGVEGPHRALLDARSTMDTVLHLQPDLDLVLTLET